MSNDSQTNLLLKLAGYALQTIGGILLCILGYLVWDCYKTIQDHERRIVRVETNADNSVKAIQDLKDGVKAVNDKLDRLLELMARKGP